jgi:predicted transcriptional regulator
MFKKSFCEQFIRGYSTAIRIAIALDLMNRYSLSQFQAAKLAKVPQPLINYVIHKKRKVHNLEKILKSSNISNIIKEFSDKLMHGSEIDMCEICIRIRGFIERK